MKPALHPRSLALALACAALPLAAMAQKVDLGPGLTSLQRFQVYPHLDKGLQALARGDHARAVRAFEQAHRLGPNSPVVALHLANAWRLAGQPERARAVLTTQLQRNPGHTGLAQALAELPSPAAPPAVAQAPAAPVAAPAPAPAPAPATAAPAPTADPAARGPLATPSPRPAPTPAPRRAPAPTAPPDTPAQQAHAAATRAYAASAQRAHAAALAEARTAVRLAPERLDYRRLLVHALLEAGHTEEADLDRRRLLERALRDASHIDEADAEAARLQAMAPFAQQAQAQALRDTVRQRRAVADFLHVKQAAEQGDAATALRLASEATARTPSALPLRLQWLGLLLQAGQHAQAVQVATDGLALAEHPALHLLRGAAWQAQGDAAQATRDFDAALALPGQTEAARRNARLIAADAALAARDAARAEALLAPLPPGPDSAGRLAEAQAAQQPHITPASLRTPAMRLPLVRCFGTPAGAACEVWPGQDTPDAGQDAAQRAYAAYTARRYADAAEHALQATNANPAHLPYRLLRLQALAADGRVAQAIDEAGQHLHAQPAAPGAAELLALRSRLHQQLGQTTLAAQDARAALAAGGLSLSSEVDLLLQEDHASEAAARFAQAMQAPALQASADPDLAYLATRVGDDATGLAVFNRAHAQGALPVTSWQDAAYTASRLADNDTALGYFRQAIDAAADGRLALTPRRHFETRREIADRARTWGVNALLGYRGISPGLGAAATGYGDVAQLVGEAYWRPQGYRDGSFWELYGGLAQTLYSKRGGATGSATTQGALGLRVKPLRAHNLVLSAERRVRIGSLSANDWLLRAGYSGGTGTDLRVDVPDWPTVHLFAEAGRFLRAKRDYLTFEAQAGRSWRLDGGSAAGSGRWVLFPHAVLGVDYSTPRTPAGYNGAAGLGLGLGVRHWFREDAHHAPRAYLDLSLQHRWRLAGDERGKGWFLRASVVY
ncbi:MAG: tetratricopeptide repeat protein [Pseudomonadota bacterium]|nr:tetratricopeptide repeat protein [Pseudomonadota bacterium]